MGKVKKSHHKSESKGDDSDEKSSSEQSSSSGEENNTVDHKRRHHKKSKKLRKHKSKRKETSESESAGDSDSESSDSSSDDEAIKRKKQKKHKKNKHRRRHEAKEKGNTVDSDIAERNEEAEIEIKKDSQKVHYVSSSEDERQRHKRNKPLDEPKKPRAPPFEEKQIKSKWDSPIDDHERKRYKESRDRPESSNRGSGGHGDVRRSRSEDNLRGEKRQSSLGRRDRHTEREQRPGDRRRNDEPRKDFQRQQPEHFRPKRPMSRSRSRSAETKKSRNFDRRNHGPERDVDRPRFNDNRNLNRGARPRCSPSPQQRDDFNRNRDNFAHNRRSPEIRRRSPREEFNRRDNYRRDREFNERPRGGRQEQEHRNSHDAPRQVNRDKPWRDQDRERDRDRTRDRDRDRNAPQRDRREWRDRERSPVRVNPFRRNDNGWNDGNDHHSEAKSREYSRDNRQNRSPGRQKFPKRDSDNENYEWGRQSDKNRTDDEPPANEKEKPDFGLSGKLTEDANKVNGVVLKYVEPPEARKPKRRWRLYPFKGDKSLQTMYIHRQSCYLIGRDKKICELAVDHPSCSKQHAALQYRLVPYEREDGTVGKKICPYIIDLESANGTWVNNKKIEPRKYMELFEKDVLKFGYSTREYVLLHENSNNTEDDEVSADDVRLKSEPREE